MNNKLEKELIKLSKKEDSNSCKKIEDATLLLNAPAENLSILKQINLDYQVHKNEAVVAVKNKLDSLATLFNRNTLTGDQIKNLCNHYDLKCYFAEDYKGIIPIELSTKLVEFEKETKIHLRSRNCFILSTKRSFQSKDDLNDNCVFLFREGENTNKAHTDEVFTVIHSWGDNIKENRKYNFLISRQIFLALILLIPSMFIPSIIFSTVILFTGIGLILDKCLTEQTDDISWNTLEEK